jgi:hypothetical protein
MVPYCGSPDDGFTPIEPEEIGTDLPKVEWMDGADEVRTWAIGLGD